MPRQELVYQEWDSTLVPSSHGNNIHYRVFWGTVNWSGQSADLQKAVVVFMQYGSTQDWAAAWAANEISLHMPAHLLSQDVAAG